MTEKELAGRTALVTGGSRGIGRAICVRLAQAGADVAINYLGNEAAAQETKRLVEADGATATVVQADVADPDQVSAMVAATERSLAPIDLLVTSAGIVWFGSHNDMTFADWKRVMTVNTDGTFLPVTAVKDGMLARQFGRIVCISSIAALRPRPMQLAYAASKAAVVSLTQSWSEAFAPHVRVNCIAPGLIATDMAAEANPAAVDRMIAGTPLKRLGRPEEIAELAYFLLSERSSFTSGQTYVASGGRVTLP